MNEEYNPYTQNDNNQPVREDMPPEYLQQKAQEPQPQPEPQPQNYAQQSYTQPQNYAQQSYSQPQNYVQPSYTQQQQPTYVQPPIRPAYYQPPVRVPGGGLAKAFSIASFAAGCISMLIVFIMIIAAATVTSYYYRSSTYAGFAGTLFIYALILSIPGLVFGIISLVKKTRLFPMGLMGVIFNGVLLLQMFIFLMMAS